MRPQIHTENFLETPRRFDDKLYTLLDGTISLHSMWNKPSVVLPATSIMPVDSGADMISLGGINDKFATPVTEMANVAQVRL